MKKIIISGFMLVATLAIAAGATTAFYNDTETSTGNVLTAGNIDLTVDSLGSTYNDGNIFDSDFPAVDLTDEKFFEFGDIKPGDFGWRHLSIHAEDNPAWACLFIDNINDDENTPVEPEFDAGDTADVGIPNGELSKNMELFAWEDLLPNGIYKPANETALPVTPDSFFDIAYIAYADSLSAILPLAGLGDMRNIGLFWCAGNIVVNPLGLLIKPGLPGSTLECDGSGMSDIAQTDIFTADMVVFAEQVRNNGNFKCEDVVLP